MLCISIVHSMCDCRFDIWRTGSDAAGKMPRPAVGPTQSVNQQCTKPGEIETENIHDETVIFALCGAWEDGVAVCVLAGGEVECPEEDGGLDEDAVVRNMAPNENSAC